MRITMAVALCIAPLLANPVLQPEPGEIGMGVLMIWPSARSTALAGAMTGLADEADATYFNPAGLAFQPTAEAEANYGSWLPELYPNVSYSYAAGSAPLRSPFLNGRRAVMAGSLTYMKIGTDYDGKFIGGPGAWRASLAFHSGVEISRKLGAGVTVKLNHSAHQLWYWEAIDIAQSPVAGFDMGGTATGLAFGAGALYRPTSSVSIGLSIDNLGPDVSYFDQGWKSSYSYVAELPRMARLGACWLPVENRYVRLRVMPELTAVLVGMFRDSTGTRSTWQQLGDEWQDVWKAVGVEATAFKFVSLRLGYLEDLSNQRGGIIVRNGWRTYHYGISDILTREDLGEFEHVGLCWGFGIGYGDYFRIDVSSDAAIYDFPTSNWKLSLVANDIAGGIRELRQGHVPWKE